MPNFPSHAIPTNPSRVGTLALALLLVAAGAACEGHSNAARPPDASLETDAFSSGSCLGEGQTLMLGTDQTCCQGLTTVGCSERTTPPNLPTGAAACAEALFQCGICVQRCGDGKCTTGENACNCPQDCGSSAPSPGCHPDDTPFPTPAGYWDWWLANRGLRNPEVQCCQSTSRIFPYDDKCGSTIEPPIQLICFPQTQCGNRTCDGLETPCSCPWDCLTESTGCYREGYTFNPRTKAGSLPLAPDPGGCCPGLVAVPVIAPLPPGSALVCSSDNFGDRVCLRCGNGRCDGGENSCNCPSDCPQ